GRAHADPPRHAARASRPGDLPDSGWPGGGLPGVGHPVDDPPVPGLGARLPRLLRESPRALGPAPRPERPLPPDQQDSGLSDGPPRPAGRRAARVPPPPVRRDGLGADGAGAPRLLHARPAPPAGRRAEAVPESSSRAVRPD